MENYNYDELVQLKQEGKISWLQFVNLSNEQEDFAEWCEKHKFSQTNETAQLFLDALEENLFNNQ